MQNSQTQTRIFQLQKPQHGKNPNHRENKFLINPHHCYKFNITDIKFKITLLQS